MGYPEVIVRTDGEKLDCCVELKSWRKTHRSRCQNYTQCKPSIRDSRSAGHAESGVRIVEEKVCTLICFALELHGVTIGKSHVSLPWCVRFAAQIISRSHHGTDGMTGCRTAYGRPRKPLRDVLWSEEVFYLQSKRKVQVEAKWHEGIFLGIKYEPEIAVVGTPHGIVLSPWELQPRAEGGVVNRSLMSRLQSKRDKSTADSRGTVAKTSTSLHQASSGIGEVRVHRRMYRVPACKIGIGAGGSQRGMPCQDCQAHDR